MSDKVKLGRDYAQALESGDDKRAKKIMMEVLLDIRQALLDGERGVKSGPKVKRTKERKVVKAQLLESSTGPSESQEMGSLEVD